MRVGRAGRTSAAPAVSDGKSESQGQPLKIRDAPQLNARQGRRPAVRLADELLPDVIVKDHMKLIYQRLGASSRSEAVATALQEGLIKR